MRLFRRLATLLSLHNCSWWELEHVKTAKLTYVWKGPDFAGDLNWEGSKLHPVKVERSLGKRFAVYGGTAGGGMAMLHDLPLIPTGVRCMDSGCELWFHRDAGRLRVILFRLALRLWILARFLKVQTIHALCALGLGYVQDGELPDWYCIGRKNPSAGTVSKMAKLKLHTRRLLNRHRAEKVRADRRQALERSRGVTWRKRRE